MEDKPLRRVLEIVHGEYEFDPVVSEEHRQWWFQNCFRCLIDHCRFYEEIYLLI